MDKERKIFLFEKQLCWIRPLTVEDFLQFEPCRRAVEVWLRPQLQTEEAAVLAHNLTLAFFCLFQGERRVFASPMDGCSRLTLDQLAQIGELYAQEGGSFAPADLDREGWHEGGENTEFCRQIEADQRGNLDVPAGDGQK